MAGAIGYALVQPPAVALVIFFALALGFAAPFSLISLFPALGKWLPRPGAWMNTLKRGLAFPMFGPSAGWYGYWLSRLAPPLAAILAASVVLSFAAWLYGMAQQRRFAGKRHLALFAVTAVLILAVIVPLPSVIKNGAPVQTAAHIEEVKWSPQNVADNRGHGKAIFVNFTASWCITCQVNEKTSLTTQAVKEALARTGTLYMVADSTKFNADIDDAMNALGQGSLPLYVVYPADGSEPKILPQVLTPSIVVNALTQASGKKT
jgi:thiol:disulfide interchange protein DsbD